MFPYLDVTGPDKRCFALEVPRVYHVIFSGVQDEFGQVYLAPVDGIEQSRPASSQPLAVVRVAHLKLRQVDRCG